MGADDHGVVGLRWRGRRSGWREGMFGGRRCDHSKKITLGTGLWKKGSFRLILVGVYYSVCFFQEFIAGIGPLTRMGATMGVVLSQ